MTTSQKLTKRFVEGVQPDAKEELLIWDVEIKGFGVRVYPTGRRTYFVQYRNEYHRTRRKKIGVHGQVTTEQAREMAKSILGDVAKGEDPSKETRERKLKASMSDLCADYLTIHAEPKKKPKPYKEDVRMINKIILPRWSDRKIEEMTPHDIQSLLTERSKTRYVANRVRSLLHKMFELAIQWKWVSENPVKGTSQFQEHKRETWLNEEGMEKLWEALDNYHSQRVIDAIKLMLLTGARRGEALSAKWEQFDIEKGVWTMSSHNTKQKKLHHVPLSTPTIELLKKMKEESLDAVYLFPGNVPGNPLTDIKKAWATIRKKAGIGECRIHDLRHTYASHLVSSGMSLSIVGKLLGHTQASTTQRYAHLADAPLRQATELFGTKLAEGIGKGIAQKTRVLHRLI